MPIQFNPKSIIVFASTVSPVFITFYLILEGAFNGHVKFIVYLVGLFITLLIGILLRGDKTSIDTSPEGMGKYMKCVTFDGPFNVSNSIRDGPSSHAIFHFFTIMYMLQGIVNNPNDIGWPFALVLIIIATIDLSLRNSNNCNTMTDIIKGAALGIFGSLLYWQSINTASFPGKEQLYFMKENTMKKCKLSKKLKFRCTKGDKEVIV
tara:strand:+ start:149 stop:769 length:621 start_codon:yes stop_codon:yes gene_type:complete